MAGLICYGGTMQHVTDTDDSRTCERCATPFSPGSPTQRFCSSRCRKRSWDKAAGVYSGAQRRKARGAPKRKVIGLDGEGLDGPPRYLMLLGSDGSGVGAEDGLTTEECLRYLVSLPQDALLWSFAFSYDVNMILGSWPHDVLTELWHSITAPGGTCTVRHGRWSVRWLPGKVFTVTDHDTGRRATVWDVWPFVQSSFVEWIAAEGIATPAEVAEVATMKAERGRLDAVPVADIERYCRTEVRLLAAGVSRLLGLFRTADIQPTSYYGAGSLAAALLRRHGVTEYNRPPPRRYRAAVRAAYRGGRFENSFTGWQTGGYLLDLNSAYPAAARSMPCLAHTEWRPSLGEPTTPYALCRVSWNVGGDLSPWGPFPVPLDDGALIYPATGSGWFWSPEVAAAQRTFPGGISVHESVELHTSCDHEPFGFLDDLYAERMRLRAAGDPRQQVIKLATNAIYGKLAQTVGTASMQSYAWAGLITSHCRAMILDAMAGDPANVTMIATDGITVRTLPEGITYGAGLGEWSVQPFTNMLALQPGLYFYTDGAGEDVVRSRGFGKADITLERAAAAMPLGVTPEPIDILLGRIPTTVRRFTGLGTAVSRGSWEAWRTWEDHDTAVHLNPWPRRAGLDCTPLGVSTYAPQTKPATAPRGDPREWRQRTLEHDAETDGA